MQLDSTLKKDVHAATQHAESLVAQLSSRVAVFNKFGKSFIKTAGISPDSFMQLVWEPWRRCLLLQLMRVFCTDSRLTGAATSLLP